jgi:hypothetical protein
MAIRSGYAGKDVSELQQAVIAVAGELAAAKHLQTLVVDLRLATREAEQQHTLKVDRLDVGVDEKGRCRVALLDSKAESHRKAIKASPALDPLSLLSGIKKAAVSGLVTKDHAKRLRQVMEDKV